MNVVIRDGQDGAVVEHGDHHDHHCGHGIEVKHQDRQRHEEQHAQRFGDAVDRVAVHPLEDTAALLDRVDDYRQTGGQQYNGGRRASRVGCTGNGDAAVRFFQRGRVVHPIAGHADDVAALLQDVDNVVLVVPGIPGRSHPLFRWTPPSPPSLDVCRRNTVASRMFVPIPNLRDISLAMANWSPVTILTFTPICTALAMVALACSRGGSNIGNTPTNCHLFS